MIAEDNFNTTKESLSNLSIEIQKMFKSVFLTIFDNSSNLRDAKMVIISETALDLAINDIQTDIEFISSRRKSKNISKGKIAGVIAYRISKASLFHSKNNLLANDKMFIRLNSLVSITIALNYIRCGSESIHVENLSELVYSISRRHVNQETLGLVFDSIRK
ncbi:MAG: hypothetical protein GW938_17220 [Leptospira sp.]|nr:hypothetical protein [Leptospira sp.]